MVAKLMDDLIRIRIDAARAVAEFRAQLQRQAAEGETMAPANPANRAIFREIAPFRLVEYSYVDPDFQAIESVCLGFPDGTLFSVSEDISEEVVDGLAALEPVGIPAVYVYVLLSEAQPALIIDRFLERLCLHLTRPMVGVFRDGQGRMTAHSYALDLPASERHLLDAQVTASVLEANRHFDKARALRLLAERRRAKDGSAFAQIIYRFVPHTAEFVDTARRDDFVTWSRTLCEWIYCRWCDWEELGLTEILRPAEIAAQPAMGGLAVKLVAPCDFEGGAPWRAFGAGGAAGVVAFRESAAAASADGLVQSVALARRYWAYVTDTIAAGEALARARADDRRRKSMLKGE